MRVEIHTDGSVIANPGGPGGWAAIIRIGERECEISGHEVAGEDVSNNRMELTAAIEGLRFLKTRREVTVYSDSEYVVKMFTESRVEKWAANNWRRHAGNGRYEAIANQDLVRELSRIAAFHDVTWVWVRGHAGNRLNERAHQAAYAQALGAVRQSEATMPSEPHNGVLGGQEHPPEGSGTPESLNGNLVAADEGETEVLPWWPDRDTPDPPPFTPFFCWTVHKRVRGRVFSGKAHWMPISPSSSGDNGKRDSITAAVMMNRSNEGPFGNLKTYAPFVGRYGTGEFEITEEEDRELRDMMANEWEIMKQEEEKVVDIGARR